MEDDIIYFAVGFKSCDISRRAGGVEPSKWTERNFYQENILQREDDEMALLVHEGGLEGER